MPDALFHCPPTRLDYIDCKWPLWYWRLSLDPRDYTYRSASSLLSSRHQSIIRDKDSGAVSVQGIQSSRKITDRRRDKSHDYRAARCLIDHRLHFNKFHRVEHTSLFTMFEDFSFSSPSSNGSLCLAIDTEDRNMTDCDSMVSPLSSRCPSPPTFYRVPRPLSRHKSSHFRPLPPTSNPYDSKRRLSITTLTQKLHAHTLAHNDGQEQSEDHAVSPSSSTFESEGPGSAKYAGYVLTPPDTDHDDEGYDETSSLASLSYPSPHSPFLSPTSVPCEYLPSDTNIESSSDVEKGMGDGHLHVRLQRQRISRLQCNAMSGVDAIKLALLAEEERRHLESLGEDCHPSSLPPLSPPGRRGSAFARNRFRRESVLGSSCDRSGADAKGRRRSAAIPGSTLSHRIDKGHYQVAGRDLRQKSDQELRRKSVVCAALESFASES